MDIIIIGAIALGGIGIAGAAALYGVSRRFHVEEDPRIGEIESLLPGANCGGCGQSGCHAFAVACAKATSLDGLFCPGAGEDAMKKIAGIVGLVAGEARPKTAIVRCNGSCELTKRRVAYDGPRSCAIAATVSAGEGGCPNGCLGCGDCVAACKWDAIHIDPTTGLPVVDDKRCTGCGACEAACPRHVIAIVDKKRPQRVWVACNNRERGPEAMKVCDVSCIACGKCAKACPFEAITVEGNIATIDQEKCRRCRKCVDVCPRNAIHTANFPVKKPQAE